MRQYGVWQAIIMSFYSKKLYRDVATNWGGVVFLYLLLLLALAMVYWTIQIQQGLNQVYVKVTDEFVAQIPVLTVKNGRISTPEKRPYLIKDGDNKEVIAIIDTTGKYKSLEGTKAGLLVTDSEIISQSKPTETRIDKLPANMSFVFDPVIVNEYIKGVFSWAWILLFPVMVIVAFLYRLVQALVYAIIGRLFGAITKSGVTYAQTLQIAMVSITPVIVLVTIIDAFNIRVPYCGLLGFLIGIGYLFYGVLANKR